VADGAPPIQRLLMTTDGVGGIWDYALTLSRRLCARGVRVDLAVLGGPLSASRRRAAESVPGLGLAERGGRLEWMPDAAEDVATSLHWLRDLVRALRPDLVQVNGYAHAAIGLDVPTLLVGHSCVRSWFAAVEGREAPDTYGAYGRGVRRGLAAADRIVTPSRAMADALRRHYGCRRDITIVHNGLEPPAIPRQAKERLVLAAGRVWDAAKNIQALDGVAPLLPAPVLVAGDTRHPDGGGTPPRHATALGWLPPQALRAWYARAAVFCLPARYEPFGLAALEAGQHGCALVLGDIPSLREVWGDAALFVPPDDRAALAATLTRLLSDPDLCRGLGDAAARRARRYTAAAMADRMLSVYADLTATRREPSCASPSSCMPSSPTGTMAMPISCAGSPSS